MTIRKHGFRALVLGLIAMAGLTLAPVAFARSHVSIGINLPGLSLGYRDGHHGHGYVNIGGYYGGGYYGNGYYGGGYYNNYYYDSPYYDSYYYAPAPVYYSRPAYYGPRYHSSYNYRGGHDSHGYRARDRGYHNRDRGYHGHGSSDPRYR